MSYELSAISDWLKTRPKWMQEAATLLWQNSQITDTQIDGLVAMCIQEACGTLAASASGFSLSTTCTTQNTHKVIQLSSISNIQGINALSPKKPLQFSSSGINVIYGDNGSGKTGYVRILKHICGAREVGNLHTNVFDPTVVKQTATINYKEDDLPEKSHIWDKDTPCSVLGCVDIFDSQIGNFFLAHDAEAKYEPLVLTFISSLAALCDIVGGKINAKIAQRVQKKPSLPPTLQATEEGVWYNNLQATTEQTTVEKNCLFSPDDKQTLDDLQKRLAERSPQSEAKKCIIQKKQLENLIATVNKHLEQLSDENVKKITQLKDDMLSKQAAAKVATEEGFPHNKLEGAGGEVWKELWMAAQKYSTMVAYKGLEYPHTADGALCVLCQQPLGQEAKNRLLDFDTFVKGEVQKSARSANIAFEDMKKLLSSFITDSDLDVLISTSGITQDERIKAIKDFFEHLTNRKNLILSGNKNIPPCPAMPNWMQELSQDIVKLDSAIAQYEEDAKGDNRQELVKKRDSLMAKQWLEQHRSVIDYEINRLKEVAKLQKAKTLTSTTVLSNKKNELATALITEAFTERFNNELKLLGAAHVKVELVKTKTSKGAVLHKLRLKNSEHDSLADVLSEGEHRIISIAAFLADTSAKPFSGSFIFDDPISSLDQDYEMRVAQRLVQLSLERQVIVFTHRLSLVRLICDEAEKENMKVKPISIQAKSWGAGEPRGEKEFPFTMKPSNSLNCLINEVIPQAEKAYNEDEDNVYEKSAALLCADFRKILERAIECELLSDVVCRFRRDIQTKGKLQNLALIEASDCKELDRLMTKYSFYVHQQPEEAPVQLPAPKELRDDFEFLANWLEDFKQRKKK